MRIGSSTAMLVYVRMSYFVYVRNQETPLIQVCIDRNLRFTITTHPKITQPGPAGTRHPEYKPVGLMKLPAISGSLRRNVRNELIYQGIKTQKAL